MNNKLLLSLAGLIVLGAAAYYMLVAQSIVSSDSPEGGMAMEYAPSDFVWNITDAPGADETLPRQSVALEVGGKTYALDGHDYVGCAANDSWPDEENEISKVICWWAGGGYEVGVFAENGAYLVKERWVQESGGPDVDADPEGPWETLFEIK